MAQKIHFKTGRNHGLVTPCPYDKRCDFDSRRVVLVGSLSCLKCKYHADSDEDYCIICNHE